MADITLAQLTEGTVGGAGVFDELMKAVSAHLDDQYQKSRITGADYATVYLGAMQSAMAQSVQFLLGEQTADKQAELLKNQALTEIAKATNTSAQTATEAVKKSDIEAQTKLVEQKTVTELSQTYDNVAANTPVAGTVKLQQDLIKEQVLLETAKELNTDAQSALIAQKTTTELAQTYNDVATDTPVGGTVFKQQALLAAQTEGFTRDAEQKLLKIASDVYSVRRGTDTTTPENDLNITNENISEIFATAAKGIGINKNADTNATLGPKATVP